MDMEKALQNKYKKRLTEIILTQLNAEDKYMYKFPGSNNINILIWGHAYMTTVNDQPIFVLLILNRKSWLLI